MSETQNPVVAVEITANIVGSYVSNNHVQPADFLKLITDVHALVAGALSGAAPEAKPDAGQIEKPTPAQIRKSITPDALISFEDGKPYKTLRRHLTVRGIDPYAYRAKWGLPKDYPMVAPNYAAQRSELAKAIGLGRPGGRAEEAPEQV